MKHRIFYPLLCLICCWALEKFSRRTYSITNECDFCALKDLGEAELVAVVHSTGYPTAIGAVSVINHFFGRDDILLGAFKGDFGREVVFAFLTLISVLSVFLAHFDFNNLLDLLFPTLVYFFFPVLVL